MDTADLFGRLLHIAAKVAVTPVPPVLRVEVKPRDFCLENRMPIMVDTFPTVLARSCGRYIVAHRALMRSCEAVLDRDEVLTVTGGAVGVFRNLCEHMFAIDPDRTSQWKAEVLAFTRSMDAGLSLDLADYLESPACRRKVIILQNRINERRSR
jgi:hypothetical protein